MRIARCRGAHTGGGDPLHGDGVGRSVVLLPMFMFGPISSLFDFLTFGLMLGVLHAGETEFHTGWFVESLATQMLIVFAIRTRRVPFLRSRPGTVLTVTILSVVAIGVVLTLVPLRRTLGFTVLPWQFWVALLAFIITYLLLVEVMKKVFYSEPMRVFGRPDRTRGRRHRIERRAARFSLGGRIPHSSGPGRSIPSTPWG